MWLAIVRLLLEVVAAIMKRRSDSEQQQIGADRVVQKALLEVVARSRLARNIDNDSEHWDADTIDSILQRYYRNEGNNGDSNP